MKSRLAHEILRAFIKIHTELKGKRMSSKMHRLDNECPKSFKRYMKEENITYQLVPSHIHRRNIAEKAISTFKVHLITGLSSVSPEMPMHLWCRLLPQALLTLNLLRKSRINPKLFSYAQLNGQHDYNANSSAPPGIQVLIHEKIQLESHRRLMVSKDGTWALIWSTIGATG